MGFEDEAEQSLGRPYRLTDRRSKRTYELTSSIVPRGTSSHRSVELERSERNVSIDKWRMGPTETLEKRGTANDLQEIEDVGPKQRGILKIRRSLLLSRAFLGVSRRRTGARRQAGAI
jgi:hypothetical protein